MKEADTVKYQLSLKKDGTYELTFSMPVPSMAWVENVRKRLGQNPPPVTEIDPRMHSAIEGHKTFKEIIEDIRADASSKSATEIRFAVQKVKQAKIVRDKGTHIMEVTVVGAWAPA